MEDSPRRRLSAPTVAMLPRVADSLSFLHLEHCRVVQDDTGVCAQIERNNGTSSRVYLPIAAISTLLLGPGTSATQPAIATCARHNTVVLWTGSNSSPSPTQNSTKITKPWKPHSETPGHEVFSLRTWRWAAGEAGQARRSPVLSTHVEVGRRSGLDGWADRCALHAREGDPDYDAGVVEAVLCSQRTWR